MLGHFKWWQTDLQTQITVFVGHLFILQKWPLDEDWKMELCKQNQWHNYLISFVYFFVWSPRWQQGHRHCALWRWKWWFTVLFEFAIWPQTESTLKWITSFIIAQTHPLLRSVIISFSEITRNYWIMFIKMMEKTKAAERMAYNANGRPTKTNPHGSEQSKQSN